MPIKTICILCSMNTFSLYYTIVDLLCVRFPCFAHSLYLIYNEHNMEVPMTLNNILAFCVTFIISVILTPFIGKITKEMGIIAHTNNRTVHHGIIPRTGGYAIYVAFRDFDSYRASDLKKR